ncbi:DcaP family trimeric outer membrane transporter [Sphingomonas sp. 3-13AW]|uniref:DcaP family trimeric outer membrane transporter n=1 Tax=Sphingomonas sp. 3-13AW TaxID=3050450 RepID=UPI003BB55E5E
MLLRIFISAAFAYAAVAECQAQEASVRTEQDDLASLKAQVRELKQAVSDLREQLRIMNTTPSVPASNSAQAPTVATQTSPPPGSAPTTGSQIAQAGRPPPGNTNAERETIGDEQTGVARADTEPPPNDPNLRGFITIPGTETRVKIGGFAKVNAIYDTGPAGNRDKFVTASIPVGSRAGKNATIDASATRLSIDVRRPSSLGPLRFYLENDFYGGSGSVGYRLRQAHGQVGNTYAGYGFSAFANADALPETLDDQGPGSVAFLRVASLRQIFKIGRGLSATLSLENPSSDITLPVGASDEEPMPDVVGALRAQGRWGNIQTAVVARKIGYTLDGTEESRFAYGMTLSGLLQVRGDFLMAGFTFGNGIARYINDLGGRGYDAVVAPDGTIHRLKAYGGYLGYTHHWSERWRSNLVGSVLVLGRDEYLSPLAFRSGQYAAANLILQASPNFSAGVESLYGRHELQNGQSADVVRLQLSFKYDLVR